MVGMFSLNGAPFSHQSALHFLEANILNGRALYAISTLITFVVHVRVKLNQRSNRHVVAKLVVSGSEANDRAAANHVCPQLLDEPGCFFNRMSTSDYVVN